MDQLRLAGGLRLLGRLLGRLPGRLLGRLPGRLPGIDRRQGVPCSRNSVVQLYLISAGSSALLLPYPCGEIKLKALQSWRP